MNIELIRSTCLSFQFTVEDFPFGEENWVYKVGGKIFCIIAATEIPLRLSLKAPAEMVLELREQFAGIQPPSYLNKKYWNSFSIDGSFTWKELQSWIEVSYKEVVKGLPKSVQSQIHSKK